MKALRHTGSRQAKLLLMEMVGTKSGNQRALLSIEVLARIGDLDRGFSELLGHSEELARIIKDAVAEGRIVVANEAEALSLPDGATKLREFPESLAMTELPISMEATS